MKALDFDSVLMDDDNFRYSLFYIGVGIGLILFAFERWVVRYFFGIYKQEREYKKKIYMI